MMIKNYFILVSALFSFLNSFSQCIPDETVSGLGIYPIMLPSPCINDSYDETLTLAYPSDTVVMGIPLSVAVVSLTDVTGLPEGLSYSCNNDCVFVPNSSENLSFACFKIEGIPVESGLFTVVMNVDISTGFISIPYEWSTEFFVNPIGEGECGPTSIYELDHKYGVTPNPSTGTFNLERTEELVVLNNAEGLELESFQFVDAVDLSKHPSGVYFLRIDKKVIRVIKK